ncbi:hypothetical protein [Halopiger aswanensis]|uniref:Uncharacterized protein n=1 Tax=Halopiger aswanensis TaxID=148449 RepID=A0A419WGU7_9EURY|nr:hypothetical protein [Halopiger aswanensis]RKD94751.1 hypothetical protein ATJ93_1593 [Halopiger aswanensis]
MSEPSNPVQEQIRQVFQDLGLNPEKIRYNQSLDRYQINIGVEGTDDRFLEGIKEMGTTEPVGSTVDTRKLESVANHVHNVEIEAGTVNVIDTMRDSHYLLEIR